MHFCSSLLQNGGEDAVINGPTSGLGGAGGRGLEDGDLVREHNGGLVSKDLVEPGGARGERLRAGLGTRELLEVLLALT
eukprot:CAMPEP_0174895044 /NCGR_PEP_ID=MMETSP0167-20121228/9538_1 /TAXON_ID=38298 /ORGANISM="Rhodella maculata, Strain CCMP736" /LENGTH=78 /DNA_ID=CAMNT_0016134285 /DNA_START=420 /DNA_END=653 /DNA_ORIENTATION=+